MYTSHWMFPLPNSNDILVIACNARKREKIGRYLDMISLDRTAVIEVAVANDKPGGLTYLGSFMPKNEWYSFIEDNIGRVQGLVRIILCIVFSLFIVSSSSSFGRRSQTHDAWTRFVFDGKSPTTRSPTVTSSMSISTRGILICSNTSLRSREQPNRNRNE